MKARWLLNLALVAALAVLAVLAVYRPGIEPAPAPPALATLSPDEVGRLRLVRGSGEEVVLEKSGARWFLTAPLQARASRFRVNSLLTLARAKSESSFPAEGADLAQYGLDPPKAALWLDDEEFRFGDTNPVNFRRYVLYRGRVHLISDSHFRHITAEVDDLIDGSLLEEDLRPVSFVFPDFTLRQEDGRWRLDPPQEDVDADRINAFVDEWRFARALRVSRYADRPVTERIRIEYRLRDAEPDGDPRTLELGIVQRSPELIIYRPDEGLEYRFPEATAKRLLELAGG